MDSSSIFALSALYLELKVLTELIRLRQDQCWLDLCRFCQDGFLRCPGRRPVPARRNESALSCKKGLAATLTTSWSMVWGPRLWRALNRLRRHFVSRPGPVWDLGTGSSVLSPRIRSAWNGVYPGCWHHSCLSPLSKSPHDRCWPLKARPRHRQSLIIDLVLGKIGTEELGRIARKVQNSGDLHVRRNIGTNWNIEEEKFHNFIDATGCWWRGRGGALLNWFGILIEKLCPLRAGVSDENWMPLRPIM